MSYGHNTVTVFFAIIGGLLLIGLILFAPWLLWASLILVLAVVAAVLLLVRAISRRSTPPLEPSFTYAPVPTVERRTEPVTDVLLPSIREDYYFLFSATVRWSAMRAVMDKSEINMAALALDAIVKRARDITDQRDPDHISLVQHELARSLGTMETDATGLLEAMAESVRLDLPNEDRQRLARLAAVRKERAVWEHERKYEQSKREYLGGDVLKDPGSAVVWWLAKNDDHVAKTVEDIGLLAQLSSAANNMDVPETFQRFASEPVPAYAPDPHDPNLNGSGTSASPAGEPSATDHFDAFLQALGFGEGHPERGLLARRAANVVAKHGRQDVFDEMVRRFDTPDDPEESGEADHGG